MQKFKGLVAVLFAGVVGLTSAAWSQTPAKGATSDKKEVTIGILSREAPELKYVATELAKQGYKMNVKVIGDNIAMNNATADGSLDANFFQNQKYLDSQETQTHLGLKSYGPWLETTATILVSSKYPTLSALGNGAKVGISEDAANMARGLQLLAANGVITLKAGVALPAFNSIESNPKNLKFVATNPRSLAGMFPDLDAMLATSISVYLMNDPSIKTLAEETPEVYRNYGGVLWVVRGDAGKLPWLDATIKIMASDQWKSWVKDHYKGLKKTP